MGHGKRVQTCTCRVAGSSFPVGEGVPPSSDAGVTGEEAMFSPSQSLSINCSWCHFSAASSSIQHRRPLLKLLLVLVLLREPVTIMVSCPSTVTLCPATQCGHCPSSGRCSYACSPIVQSRQMTFSPSLSLTTTHSLSLCVTLSSLSLTSSQFTVLWNAAQVARRFTFCMTSLSSPLLRVCVCVCSCSQCLILVQCNISLA